MLIIENLHKNFDKNTVLKNINIQFEEGRMYAIVGENGAGKTTLFNCITGLETYDGNIYDTNHKIVKNKIGYLPTSSYFFPKTTGQEYLNFCAKARGVSIEMNAHVNVFDLPLNKYVDTYSTGMKKKLALTGVFIQRNDILILDEPFNGVDIQSNIMIKKIVQNLKKEGKTLILTSHIISTLTDMCDSIFLLKNCHLYAYGKADFHHLENDMTNIASENKIDAFNRYC